VKFSKEARVGLLVTVAMAALIWGINFLKGQDFFTTSNKYYAVYDNVDGLVKSNPVMMSGFRIGIINHIDFLPDNSGRLLVTLLVNNDVFVSKDASANIFSSDLLGAKSIRIDLGKSTEAAEDGDTLIPVLETSLTSRLGKQVGPVKDKVESLVVSLDSVTQMLHQLFDVNTKDNLRSSITHLNSSMNSLDNMLTSDDGKLKLIFSNLESISKNLKNNNESITHIINNLSQISDTLAKAQFASVINNADMALQEFNIVMSKINKGEGSLGLLVNDQKLYSNLDASAKNLDELLKDMKANPKRYVHFSVFGKKNK
jgi:phospholipid/cholesterol/gamma-HCH transport system substrate-binding protein